MKFLKSKLEQLNNAQPLAKLTKLKIKLKQRMQQGDPVFNYLGLIAIALISITLIAGVFMLVKRVKHPTKRTETTKLIKNEKYASGEIWVVPPEANKLVFNDTIKVSAATVQVRQAPDVEAVIIKTLKRDDNITILSTPDHGWVYVNIPGTDKYGYALEKYLKID